MCLFLLLWAQTGLRTLIPFQVSPYELEQHGVFVGQDTYLELVYWAGDQELFREPAERLVWLGDSPVLFLGSSGSRLPDQVTQRGEVRLELWYGDELISEGRIHPLSQGISARNPSDHVAEQLVSQLASVNAGYLAQVSNYMANFLSTLDLVGDSIDIIGTSHLQGQVTADNGVVFETGTQGVIFPAVCCDVLSAHWDNTSLAGYPINGYNSGRGSAGYFANYYSNNTTSTLQIHNLSHGPGIFGYCSDGRGMHLVLGPPNTEYGVYVDHAGTGVAGVFNQTNASSSSAALAATSEGSGFGLTVFATGTGQAAYFLGNVLVNGTLSSSFQSLKLEHPKHPDTLEIHHQVVASSEALNTYSDNVVLDEDGNQTVVFPDWFGGVNNDLRYQLTPVGRPAPNLYVVPQSDGSGFRIQGGLANLQVSWTVTALRQDGYSRKQPQEVVTAKSVSLSPPEKVAPPPSKDSL
ncbi:MAG: hypothetical protein KDC35_21050 [Acidobacteria bacterium]|nr:hypothetical protein [Acidobacteriota bacterium]